MNFPILGKQAAGSIIKQTAPVNQNLMRGNGVRAGVHSRVKNRITHPSAKNFHIHREQSVASMEQLVLVGVE